MSLLIHPLLKWYTMEEKQPQHRQEVKLMRWDGHIPETLYYEAKEGYAPAWRHYTNRNGSYLIRPSDRWRPIKERK